MRLHCAADVAGTVPIELSLPRLLVHPGDRVILTLPTDLPWDAGIVLPHVVRVLLGVDAAARGWVLSRGRGPLGHDACGLYPGMRLEPGSLERAIGLLGEPARDPAELLIRAGLPATQAAQLVRESGASQRPVPRSGAVADAVLHARVLANPPELLVWGVQEPPSERVVIDARTTVVVVCPEGVGQAWANALGVDSIVGCRQAVIEPG